MAARRSGLLALGVVAVAAAIFSATLWAPFAVPSVFLRSAFPAGNVLGSLALGALMMAFRRPLSAGIQRASGVLPGDARSFVPPLLGTAFFLLSWAGSHVDRPGEVGLVPELIFPATSAVFGYGVARWNRALQGRLDALFALRDHLRPRIRFLLALIVPTVLSLWLNAWLGNANPARNAQLLVILGMVTGYLILAPRGRQAVA